MKQQYEAPSLELLCFESQEDIARYSDPTDFIPETDSDDSFDW